MNTFFPYFVLWAFAAGYAVGPLISWAIRSWPGHEYLDEEYLKCSECSGGLKRGCYNAGTLQDHFLTFFSALIAGFVVLKWGIGTKAFFGWVFSVSCLIITIVDIRYLIIPDSISVYGCFLGLAYAIFCHLLWRLGAPLPEVYVPLRDSLIGFFTGGGFLWLLGWLSWIILKREGMGGGDVKLLAAIGAWMGWQPVIGVIIISSLLGSIGGVLGILYQKIRYKKEYKPLTHMIPFGPYLCIGFLFVYFWGMTPLYDLMNWYQGLFIPSLNSLD